MRILALTAAALAVTLAACGPKPDGGDFGQKVHAYLLAHPEVIEEALERLGGGRLTR